MVYYGIMILVMKKSIIIVIVVKKKKTSIYAELVFNSAFLILGIKILRIIYVNSH